ncbi:hypothetical protein POTOM_053514 [Populus tomentosa]|uniref:SAUR-like auxin-responsive protein family n=1 Tax=Populus tomentosa TaxID=118781 RepID=A0A8X7Y5Y5_POPTO|nr:hypothetical protein POTOM_053514 [Populus tomentosa]
MISAKKLVKLAKKWQKLAALRRKRITLPQMETSSCSASEMADKGHFVVYSVDHKRFLFPLSYLNKEIVRELLKLAEEEFGLPGDGPLTLPCDAELIEYAVALIRQRVTRDVEKALLVSIASSRCSLSSDVHHQFQLEPEGLDEAWNWDYQPTGIIGTIQLLFLSSPDGADSSK